ncbi:MAG TPA: tetratricopeptide repeat protein [Thermoanaerobaculia bacterium]|jgi:hypothetical protein|nr:tetratricopeptide repeat protein [Thermoanaerobaculia bacterium]
MTPVPPRRALVFFGILAILPILALSPLPEISARVTQISGVVEISGSGVRSLPVASAWQVVRQGATVRVPAEGFAGLVCSDRRFVRLKGPTVWILTSTGCNAGRLLSEAQYALVTPRAGRFSVVAGIMVVDRELRFVRGENPHAPVAFSPRYSLIRSFRPAVSWLQAPNAEEYLVEWHREDLHDRSFRVPAAEASCRREADGLDLCTFLFPADAPDLAPGMKFDLTVSARDRTSRVWFADAPVEVTAPTLKDAAQLEAALAELKTLGLGGAALTTAEAGLLASRGLFSDAANAYRQVRASDHSLELGITLADLYFVTGLDFLAEPIYREALAAESLTARTAAAFGLGRIAYERQRYPEAAGFFEQARKGYAEIGLSEEAEAAKRAAKKAAERPVRHEGQSP